MRVGARCALWLGWVAGPAWAGIVVTPGPSVDMGAAPPGQILETTITIQNTGATRLFPDLTIWGGQFWLHRTTCNLPLGIAAGATCTAMVRFSAASACSNYTADLDVFDWSGQQSVQTISITASGGVGSPPCNLNAGTNRYQRVIGPYPGTNSYAGSVVAVADLGNDGEMDAIYTVVPQAVAKADWYVEKLTKVYVYTFTASGQFQETTSRWFGTSPLMMPNLDMPVVADLNGDGKDDLAFACNNEDGRPYFDDGNVTRLWYTHQYAWISGAGDAYSVQQLGTNVEYGTGISAGDVDSDDDVDLLMSGTMPVPGQPGELGIYVLLNDGQANFSVGQILPKTTPGSGLPQLAWPRFADLDRDGDPDLLVGRFGDGRIAVFRNDAGNFVYQRDIQVFPGLRDDVADTLHVDLGLGAGVIRGPNWIEPIDMDGDGELDLVVWSYGSFDQPPFPNAHLSVIRVARGVGGLDFEPIGAPYEYAQAAGSRYLQVLPLDRDGTPDVMLLSQDRHAGRLQHRQLRNLGDGRLRIENLLAYPANDPFPDSVRLADMNRDGRLDVVYGYNGFGVPGERGVMVNAMADAMSRPLQSLSVSDVSLAEGNAGSKEATFTVSLSQPASTPVSFDVYTAPGTATPGVDYLSSAVIGKTIAAGATSTTVPVTLVGDTTVEGHESFTVNLANPLDATLADGQGLGRIVNDDLAQLSIGDASLTEGQSGAATLSFMLQLSRPTPNPVTFDITTANGTAVAGSDYVARSLAGRFLDAGRTRWVFEVAVNGDNAVEPDETFTVQISNVSGAALADGSATGTILNDDAAAKGVEASRGLRRVRAAGPSRSNTRPQH